MKISYIKGETITSMDELCELPVAYLDGKMTLRSSFMGMCACLLYDALKENRFSYVREVVSE